MGYTLVDAVQAFAPTLPLTVAFSGGADSTALLLACAERWPGQVQAVHIHHGLQAAADDFVRHCEAFCTGLQVPLQVVRVQAQPAPGESPEDAARKARHKAFGAIAQVESTQFAIKTIVLAQHADDQVETLLLALSRGAGLPGLACMPASWARDGIQYHRPLLGVRADHIRDWLAQRGVAYVTDPTNADQRFTRNRIRAQLLPVLEAAFPQFRETFARSAAHAAQAQTVLAEVAVQDLATVGNPPAIATLQSLSFARQANVLRHWLTGSHHTTPSTAQLHELQHQIAACTTRGQKIHIKVGAGFAVRRGLLLDWYNPKALPIASATAAKPG
ncbi:tRNA lysidine(34) synthetase TilS [Rhodoferax sp.]|uniref:tRNA lysidine(34) synthetase TilS n=1 Tax=Rhodoferax sp. TaxID=50421 RepID=UPI0025CE04CD|nr:tRNA lysidine(34) synthetase TilS [Rhodoferax sp.]